MDKVRIGFVGVGGMGQMAHLRNYVDLGDCEVVAIAELRSETAKLVARRYGIDKVYHDHRAMFDNEELDGVVASQPFTRHAVLLPEIYERVKYVFTEKPLAVGPDAGAALAAAAAKAGCTHMVGYHKRSDPATMYVKKLVDNWKADKKVGNMRYVRVVMPPGDWVAGGFIGMLNAGDPGPGGLENEPKPEDMDDGTYGMYVGFVNYYIHQVNLLRHLLGEAYKVVYASKNGALLVAESESGVAGVIEMATYSTGVEWEETALVGFDRAYVELALPAPLAYNRCGTVNIYDQPEGEHSRHTQPSMGWTHAMHQQAANFVKVCKGEMAPLCDAAEAVEDLKVARDYVRMLTGK